MTSLDWNALIWEPIRQNGANLVGLLPNLINAVYILVLGWLVAFTVQFLARRVLRSIRFDKIAEKTGMAAELEANDIATNPAEWVSRLFFWMVMIAAIVKASGEMRLGEVSGGLDLFSGFVFQCLGLLVIFILGLFMSLVLSKIVFTTAAHLKIKSPAAYARTIKWAVLTFMMLLVFRQMAIPLTFIMGVLGAVFVTLCLAFIIAFGVGGIGWAAKMLEKLAK